MTSPNPPLVPLARHTASFESRHGHNVAVYEYIRAETSPRAVAACILVHGYNHSASPFFDWLAAALDSAGIYCFSLDFIGHGSSDGLQGLVPSIDVLVDDLLDVARIVRRSFEPPCPLFALAESMGGAVAVQAARRVPDAFEGLVLMSPMTGFDSGVEPHYIIQALGRAVAAVAPWAPITPTRDITAVCFKDPERRAEVRSTHRMCACVQLRSFCSRVSGTCVNVRA